MLFFFFNDWTFVYAVLLFSMSFLLVLLSNFYLPRSIRPGLYIISFTKSTLTFLLNFHISLSQSRAIPPTSRKMYISPVTHFLVYLVLYIFMNMCYFPYRALDFLMKESKSYPCSHSL